MLIFVLYKRKIKDMTTTEIKATPNYSKRTFTIRKVWSDGTITKFRTLPMSKEEFKVEEYNTENDWKQFLSYSQDYYIVK